MTPTQTPDQGQTGPGPRATLQTWLIGVIAFGVLLSMLIAAKFVLISLSIAIILFSVAADATGAIARVRAGPLHIPTGLASVVAVVLLSAGLLTLATLVISQINTVVTTTLSYTEEVQTAFAQAFAFFGPDAEAAALASIRSIEFSTWLRTAAGQAGNLLSAVVLIILFVGFLFAERIWFDTKLRSLFEDAAQARQAGAIIRSITHSVNRYLLVKSFISAVTGLAVYALMKLMGLELAAAMGVLTFVLNFIPSIGSIIATIVVGLVALVQLGDLSLALIVFLLVGGFQFAVGNVIDPMLLGRTLRLSSFGIIISLAFWGLVWGVPGMFLAVPIMVAVMIICSHVPRLRPVAVLLSREGLSVEQAVATGPLAAARRDASAPPGKPAA